MLEMYSMIILFAGRPASVKSPLAQVPKSVTKKRDAPSSKSGATAGKNESEKPVISPPSTPLT